MAEEFCSETTPIGAESESTFGEKYDETVVHPRHVIEPVHEEEEDSFTLCKEWEHENSKGTVEDEEPIEIIQQDSKLEESNANEQNKCSNELVEKCDRTIDMNDKNEFAKQYGRKSFRRVSEPIVRFHHQRRFVPRRITRGNNKNRAVKKGTSSDIKQHSNLENGKEKEEISESETQILCLNQILSKVRPAVRLFQLIKSCNERKSKMKITDFINLLESNGIRLSDPRLRETNNLIRKEKHQQDSDFTRDVFVRICSQNFEFIRNTLLGQLTIPGFSSFKQRIRQVFDSVSSILTSVEKKKSSSEVRRNSTTSDVSFLLNRKAATGNSFSMSICTTDGQRLSFGEDGFHPLNACANVLNYCIACERNGIEGMESFLCSTPLPRPEDEFEVDEKGRVWNPFTKAGCVVTSSLLQNKHEDVETRLTALQDIYSKAMAGEPMCCDNLSYNLKRLYAHEEISLAYFLSARQKLPKSYTVTPGDVIELNFQSTSTATSCGTASTAAATLAAGGICPLTGERIFEENIVRHVLKSMQSSDVLGLNKNTDESQRISVAWSEYGSIFLVIPGVLGLTCFTQCQPTNVMQELVLKLVQSLTSTFNFSIYRRLKKGRTFLLE